LIAVAIVLVILMVGLAIPLLYALQVDVRFGRDAWRKLDQKHRRLQLAALLIWLVGIAAAFGVGYAIVGTWKGGVAGAAVWGAGLAVIGPVFALGARRKT
jgi:hypothetical protein